MATPVIMPRQGQSVESCIIAKWHKNIGDAVKVGDVLFTYETDKATFEEEATVEGTLLGIFYDEDDDVPVLNNVCVIGQEGEDASEFNPNSEGSSDGTSESKEEKQEVQESQQQIKENASDDIVLEKRQAGEIIRVSPRAKNLADKVGVDYSQTQGTGPLGRVIERDIQALEAQGPKVTKAVKEAMLTSDVSGITGTGLGGRITTYDMKQAALGVDQTVSGEQTQTLEPQYQDVKLTNIRKVIAKAMHQSLSSTAQLTLNTSFDATSILNYRKQLKAGREKLGLENITLNDIVLYAVSRTLLTHKELNAHFLEDKIRLFENVNLGMAVDTERGLLVPTLFNANLKTLNEIAYETKALAEQAQKGTINPDNLQGGTFTITNLGALDIESFTPVLNAPQTGILGVNNIVQRAKEVNGEYEFYPAMGLSLTFDHRAVDGAPAARFLKDLKANLENFSILLAK